jgi:hypothetical protein
MSNTPSDNGEKKEDPRSKNWFKPGTVPNPKGRGKGTRNKLGEMFLQALHDDFNAHGISVIEKVREEKPDQYLKVVASILPKELNVKTDALGELSDDELTALLEGVRSLVLAGAVSASGEGSEKASRH